MIVSIFIILMVNGIRAEEGQMARENLRTYRQKRDFTISPEPQGGKTKKKASKNLFMIHKHDARRLHFDLRVQVGSVLASWAVPKGPSLNPKDKRLAVHVEDHPLAYADFEGVIPQGEYGGGTVMIWDQGTYENRTEHAGKQVPLKKAIKEGHIELFFQGERMQGLFTLVRMHTLEHKEQWLLIKMQDKYASARRNPVKSQTKSVASGRTMRQIAQEHKEYGISKERS